LDDPPPDDLEQILESVVMSDIWLYDGMHKKMNLFCCPFMADSTLFQFYLYSRSRVIGDADHGIVSNSKDYYKSQLAMSVKVHLSILTEPQFTRQN